MDIEDQVSVWEETKEIPTYPIGLPDKNPMFLEKRVYQGSSGKVYPFPIIDKIYDRKVMKKWKIVYLENRYLKIAVMPELGGRIQRALDKTNGYDFVYYNHVIKPALVGLAGPWISGGIEFNWPQHHRPSTFLPVEYSLKENGDGSKKEPRIFPEGLRRPERTRKRRILQRPAAGNHFLSGRRSSQAWQRRRSAGKFQQVDSVWKKAPWRPCRP